MQKLMKHLHKSEKGFTLVELMVVVVIIGILVAIAIPLMGAIQERAQRRACHANQRTIDGATMMWYAADTANSGAPGMAALEGTYLAQEPFCPEDGTTAYSPAAVDAGDRTTCPTNTHETYGGS